MVAPPPDKSGLEVPEKLAVIHYLCSLPPISASEFDPVDMQADAVRLFENEWPPLLLGGSDGKKLLVSGITGYSPYDASLADIKRWRFGKGRNLGVRCPVGVIGIDIDDGYPDKKGRIKRGLMTVAEYEANFSELPATFMTTARLGGSGIRWFRVPEDWRGPGNLKAADGSDGDVELIQRHHRYGVVPRSIHYTGNEYRLFGPDGREIAGGLLPPPSELTELSASWFDGLAALCTTKAKAKAKGREFNRDEIERWLDTHDGNDYPHGLPQAVKRFHSLVDSGKKNRHNAMIDVMTLACKEVAAGGYPGSEAKQRLRDEWLTAIADSPDHDEAEFDAMWPWTISEAEADDHAARWKRMCRDYGTDTRDYASLVDGFHIQTESAESNETPPTWSPVDMATALDGTEEVATTILARTDGVNLFYRGKVHSVHGESESGKTWLALCAVAECLNAGEPVLYIDFEDDAKGVGGRLLLLGVPRSIVTNPAVFSYVRPEAGWSTDTERKAFEDLLSEWFSLAVLDGVTESMGLFGLVGKDNDNVATWQRTLPNAISRATGAAVVCIDHVTKSTDGRGRFAIGGQQKMAGLSGAAFIIEPDSAFGRGLAGDASVRVGKDRPGFLRGIGGPWRKDDRTQLVAKFHLDSTDDGRTLWRLEPPDGNAAPASGHPDLSHRKWCMEQISRHWEELNPSSDSDPKSKPLRACSATKTQDAMLAAHSQAGIARDAWRAAIQALVIEGYARQVDGPRNSHLHIVIRPYREDADETPDSPNVQFHTELEASCRGQEQADSGESAGQDSGENS